MRVLQINSVCGIGSTGRIATDIHDVLIEKGHESYIAYSRDLPRNCNNIIKIGTIYDVYKHVALTRIFDKHGFGSKRATKKLIKETNQINPDIIHLHNIHGYYINIAILFNYLKKIDKPVVWTLHDCWSFTGHCAHFDYVGCERWRDRCYNCPQKKEYPKSLLFDNSRDNFSKKREIFSGVDNLTIVTPSQWLSELVKRSFLKDYSIEIINNGIDLDVFKPTKNNFKGKNNLQNKFVILGVASGWGKRKGYEYFKDLSKLLDKDESIVMVGISENQKRELPKNIIGITRTNNPMELAEIYSSADVFINLTLEDNFPTTNLESLACGTPVITFNTGGSIESIDEKTGFIVEKENLEELLSRIREVKINGKGEYGKDCVSRARKLYNKNDRYNDYIDLYKKVLNI